MTPPPPPDYCLWFIDHWSTCMQKAEWASWVQAIGSIAAIAGAIWIVRYQMLQQARQQHLAQLRADASQAQNILVASAAIGMACAIFDQKIPPKLAPGLEMTKFNLNYLERAISRLDRILDQAERPTMATLLATRLASETEQFRDALAELNAPGDLTQWPRAYGTAKHWSDSLTEALTRMGDVAMNLENLHDKAAASKPGFGR